MIFYVVGLLGRLGVGCVDHCLACIHIYLYPAVLCTTLFGVVRCTGLVEAHTQYVLQLLCCNALGQMSVNEVPLQEPYILLPEGQTSASKDASSWAYRSSARRDMGTTNGHAAVRAALSLPWSTGPVEGQISRLKTIKRTMYGRAGVELLRHWVLEAG